MSEQPITFSSTPIDNKTLTLVTTALIAASNLLPSESGKKIGAASAPVVTITLAYLFRKGKNMLYMWIEQTRAKNAYASVLKDLNEKLLVCDQRDKAKSK